MSAISLFVATLLSLSATQQNNAVCHRDCTTSDSGVQFVAHFEGFSPFVYKDVAGKDTIGNGHLIRPGEHFSEPMLPEEAHNLLKKDLREAERGVNRLVVVPLLQHEADAVISFTFNLGSGSLSVSTLLKKINAQLKDDAAKWFLPWNKATDPKTKKKVVVRGLTVRREAESDMYSGESL